MEAVWVAIDHSVHIQLRDFVEELVFDQATVLKSCNGGVLHQSYIHSEDIIGPERCSLGRM